MKICISCGGTGGHIYPALAIAEEMNSSDIFFIGNTDRLNKDLIPNLGYKFNRIPTSRKNPFIILNALLKSIILIKQAQPDWIICTGGYATLPVCLAAILLRKKILLQEQNTIPGKVNRLIGIFATKIALGIPTHKKYFSEKKTQVTGNPVRKIFLHIIKKRPIPQPLKSIPKEHNKILIMGGSQGAHSLNKLVLDIAISGIENTSFTLVCGKSNFNKVILTFREHCKEVESSENYIIFKTKKHSYISIISYTEEIASIMRSSDIIVSRSGASALSEITLIGKPTILIPYPFAADDHQKYNALYYKDNNAAIMIDNHELSATKLKGIINHILLHKEEADCLAKNIKKLAKEDAAKAIINILKS